MANLGPGAMTEYCGFGSGVAIRIKYLRWLGLVDGDGNGDGDGYVW